MNARLVKHNHVTKLMGLNVGDVGEIIENGMPEKYAHCVDFGTLTDSGADIGFFTGVTTFVRKIYFYADEVEVLP